MKTKSIILAVLLISSISLAYAGAPKRTLSLQASMGKILVMPVFEETPDSLSSENMELLSSVRENRLHRIYDLTSMTKPEPVIEEAIPSLEKK